MGIHEREAIEIAEKIIVKILNSEKLNKADEENRWLNHARALAKRINNDFPNLVSSRHLGNEYDSIGDISLKLKTGKEVFLEVKMSEKKSGVGTKANISQDSLTNLGLFKGEIKSWSEFRRGKKHKTWVREYLNEFEKYPKKIERLEENNEEIFTKADYLRDLKKRNGQNSQKAKEILNDIRERDREEKLGYLSYLEKQKQNKLRIKNFLTLILLGIHTQERTDSLISKKDLSKDAGTLIIYYSNEKSGKISIRKENAGDRVKEVIDAYKSFKIVFPEGNTHCKLVGVKNKKEVSLLQIVLHWKNISQGIKTPCLNIFDLTA